MIVITNDLKQILWAKSAEVVEYSDWIFAER